MNKATIFFLFFFFVFFSACLENKLEEDSPIEHQTEQTIHQIPEGDLEILLIEDCEYIVFKDGRGSNHGFGYMSHKGNCKNPIHIYQMPPQDSINSAEEEE